MAAPGAAPAASLLKYYGPKATLNGLQIRMPLTPEEVRAACCAQAWPLLHAQHMPHSTPRIAAQLEFYAEHEYVRIVPNFSLPEGELIGIGVRT